VQEAMRASGLEELATPTLAEGESAADLLVTDGDLGAEIAAESADRIALLHEGRIVLDDAPSRVFFDAQIMAETGVGRPAVAELAADLNRQLGTTYAWVSASQAQADLASALDGGHPA